MPRDEPEQNERRETIEELAELIAVVQEMGRRLANETHGASYDLVLELNQRIHQTREQIALIRASSPGA